MTTMQRISEAEWLTAVGDTLDYCGWLWFHSRPARRTNGRWVTASQGNGAKGFPDVTAVRDDRTVFLELKAEGGRVSPEQYAWIGALQDAGQEAYIMKLPGDWDTFTALTARPPHQFTMTSNTTAACHGGTGSAYCRLCAS